MNCTRSTDSAQYIFIDKANRRKQKVFWDGANVLGEQNAIPRKPSRPARDEDVCRYTIGFANSRTDWNNFDCRSVFISNVVLDNKHGPRTPLHAAFIWEVRIKEFSETWRIRVNNRYHRLLRKKERAQMCSLLVIPGSPDSQYYIFL